MNVTIVESPIKSKTISKYLKEAGVTDMKVMSSSGHIVDLPTKDMSIEKDGAGFHATYKIIPGKSKLVNDIKEACKKADTIFIMTDDDREGEKICYDLVEYCNINSYYRVTIREITKKAIISTLVDRYGIRLIDQNIVRGQMARRESDRIIGYGITPCIQYHFKNKNIPFDTHGSGRVEAIALSILAERFDNQKKYEENGPTVENLVLARYRYKGYTFDLIGKNLTYKPSETVDMHLVIKRAMMYAHEVAAYEPRIDDREPPKPLISSTLYSTASYVLNMKPTDTEKYAQLLFQHGFINYPRTDSYALSDEANEGIKNYLLSIVTKLENTRQELLLRFSSYEEANQNQSYCTLEKNIEDLTEAILPTARTYKNAENAQEAHECIRPINFDNRYAPSAIEKIWKSSSEYADLGEEHLKLYKLIWARTIVTRLANSVYDKSKLTVTAGEFIFSGNAHECLNRGWELYYEKLFKDSVHESDIWHRQPVILPKDLYSGVEIINKEVDYYEKKSRKPKRISEGALIAELGSKGVARPSTLHTYSSKLIKKGYIVANSNLLDIKPSGLAVFNFLQEYAPWMVNTDEAHQFEETIISIEKGEILDTKPILNDYWSKIDALKDKIGFVSYEKRGPSDKQKDMALVIFNELDKDAQSKIDINLILSNAIETSSFISSQIEIKKLDALKTSIGKCPNCKDNAPIIEMSSLFECSNKRCSLKIWKKNILGFFEHFKRPMDEQHMQIFIHVLLKDKVALCRGLVGGGDAFDTYVELKYNREYKNWGLSFSKKYSTKKEHGSIGEWENIEISTPQQNTPEEKINTQVQQLEYSKEERRLLNNQAIKCSLTRAFNRKALNSDIKKIIQIKSHEKINNLIACTFIDFDHLKNINDIHGHEMGDNVLVSAVNQMFSIAKEYPCRVYRYTGGEFVLLYYGIEQKIVIESINLLRENIYNLILDDNLQKITFSSGLCMHIDNESMADLLYRTDQAMFEAKESGRNQTVIGVQ